MSRMIHWLAWAYNPLHLRWIIYTTLPYTDMVCQFTLMFFLCFHLPDGMWDWPTQLLNIQSGFKQSRRLDSSVSNTINTQVNMYNSALLVIGSNKAMHNNIQKNITFPIPAIICVVNETCVGFWRQMFAHTSASCLPEPVFQALNITLTSSPLNTRREV